VSVWCLGVFVACCVLRAACCMLRVEWCEFVAQVADSSADLAW
jgi:hypothetical protein